jgi:hypothetical protein
LPNSEVPQSKVSVKSLLFLFVDQRQLFGCLGRQAAGSNWSALVTFPGSTGYQLQFQTPAYRRRVATYAGVFPAYRFQMGEKRLNNPCSGYRPLRYCPPSPGLHTGEMPWHSEGCKSKEAETGDREGRGTVKEQRGDRKNTHQ